MSYIPKEEELIDYLYGNLPIEKKAVIKEYLDNNPEKREELEGVSEARNMLGKYEEHEVIPPEFEVPGQKHQIKRSVPFVKTIMAIAASVALLMIVGFLTDFNAEYNNGELAMRFGEKKNVESLDNSKLDRLEKMIANLQVEQSNAQVIEAKLDEYFEEQEKSYQNKWKALTNNMQAGLKKFTNEEKEALATYLDQIRSENIKNMDEYYLTNNTRQQEYIEGVLIDFTKYMDEQRLQDRQFYVDHLVDIKYNSELEQQETEQMLASIINKVNTITNESETQNF